MFEDDGVCPGAGAVRLLPRTNADWDWNAEISPSIEEAMTAATTAKTVLVNFMVDIDCLVGLSWLIDYGY